MSAQQVPDEPGFQPPSLEELSALLPQFEMLDFLAQGGMGAVYLARQLSLDRLVAIKVLPPALGAEAGYAEHFRTEAKAMAKLPHSHIVAVYDFGITSTGLLYLVMEYVPGQTLHEMIRLRRLPLAKVQGLALQICDGMIAAHEGGVLHRDIKPGNVLVSNAGEVKIADFGLARHTEAALEEHSLGTPDFAAPELLTAGAMVDHRADIYALGIVFQEMLAGKVPRRPREPLAEHGAFDPAWEALIAKATSHDPARRFQSVRELREAVAHVGKRAIKTGPSPAAPRRMAPRQSVSSRSPSHTSSWTSLLVILLLIGGAAFWWMRNRNELHTVAPAANAPAAPVYQNAPMPPTAPTPPPAAPSGRTSSVAPTPVPATAFSFDAKSPGHILKLREGHKDVINDVAVFPDQRRVASASSDRTIGVWDLQAGERIRTFGPVSGSLLRVAISPEGRYVAAGSGDSKAYVWSMDAPAEPPREFTAKARSIPYMVFSVDGASLILGTSEASQSLLVWDWMKGTSELVPGFRPVPYAVELLPGSDPNAFLVIGQRTETGPPPAKTLTVFTELWQGDLKRRSLMKQLPTPPSAFHMRVTPDGSRCAGFSKGRVSSWELQTGKRIAQSAVFPFLAGDIELLDNGRLVLLGTQDRCLRLVELTTGKEVWTSAPEETQCTNCPAVLSDGRYVVAGGGKRLGPAGSPAQKDGDYALHVWALPDFAFSNSALANARPTPAFKTDDAELWTLVQRLAAEWDEKLAGASKAPHKDLDEKYLAAIRRDLNSVAAADRDYFLNELSRISNGESDPLDPAAPASLVRLHDIYQQQLALLPQSPAMQNELCASQLAQLDALQKSRAEKGDAAGAARVQLAKDALASANSVADRGKVLRQLLQTAGQPR